jgi:hypothetical protein
MQATGYLGSRDRFRRRTVEKPASAMATFRIHGWLSRCRSDSEPNHSGVRAIRRLRLSGKRSRRARVPCGRRCSLWLQSGSPTFAAASRSKQEPAGGRQRPLVSGGSSSPPCDRRGRRPAVDSMESSRSGTASRPLAGTEPCGKRSYPRSRKRRADDVAVHCAGPSTARRCAPLASRGLSSPR